MVTIYNCIWWYIKCVHIYFFKFILFPFLFRYWCLKKKRENLVKCLDFTETQQKWPSMETMRPGLMMGRMSSVTSLSPDLVSNGSLKKCRVHMHKLLKRHRFFFFNIFLACVALFLWDKFLLRNIILTKEYYVIKSNIVSLTVLSEFLNPVWSHPVLTGIV